MVGVGVGGIRGVMGVGVGVAVRVAVAVGGRVVGMGMGMGMGWKGAGRGRVCGGVRRGVGVIGVGGWAQSGDGEAGGVG
jgi:hypothetical protein